MGVSDFVQEAAHILTSNNYRDAHKVINKYYQVKEQCCRII